jgi:hypothetical protein
MKNAIRAEDHAIDLSKPFKPTKILCMHRSHGFSSRMELEDLTAQSKSDPEQLEYTDLNALKCKFKSMGHISYTADRQSRFPVTKQVIGDRTGREVCSITTDLLKLGGRKIAFHAMDHSDHDIEMRTSKIGSGTDCFVQNSDLYFWQAKSAKRRLLYKVIGQQRIVVAEYAQKRGYSTGGVLAVNIKNIDHVIAQATAYALITRNDS